MKKIILLISILLLSGCTSNQSEVSNLNPVKQKDGEAIITVIDVGQGSSTIIQSEDDVILVDAGEYENVDSVISTLRNLDINEIDIAIGTHPHSDHIGGMSEIMNAVKVKKLYIPDIIHTSASFEYMLDAAEKNNVAIVNPEKGLKVSVGSGEMMFLNSGKSQDFGDNLNAYSLLTKFSFGETTYLSGGDLDGAGLKAAKNDDIDFSSTIFQAFHHGSFNETNDEELMRAINPSLVLISVGENNSYGHPHQEFLTYCNQNGKTIFRTDLNGTITVVIKDGTYSVYTNKETINPDTVVPDDNTLSVIGNKNSKKYHRDNCRSLPIEKNRVYFATEEDAKNQGYVSSKDCFN